MASGNTALSYQMMYEEKWTSAMINAEMRGAIRMACRYARVLCKFIGLDKDKIPQFPMIKGKNREQIIEAIEDHYFELLEIIGDQISAKLAEVRKKYGRKDPDIPEASK